jgi:hypothetical protein
MVRVVVHDTNERLNSQPARRGGVLFEWEAYIVRAGMVHFRNLSLARGGCHVRMKWMPLDVRENTEWYNRVFTPEWMWKICEK